jgi:hypothetical protein
VGGAAAGRGAGVGGLNGPGGGAGHPGSEGGVGLPQAVRCPACGTGSHPAASVCAGCGAPLRAGVAPERARPQAPPAPVRWEYADAAIDVGLSPLEAGFLDAYDATMTQALTDYGREGWEPASPTEWREVVAADRFVAEMRAPRWWPLSGLIGGTPTVRQVLVRFRRGA